MHLTNYSVNRNNSQYHPNCNDTVRQGHKWCVLFDSGFIALGHIGQRWSVHCPSSVVSLVVISQKLSKIEPLEVGTADSVIAFRPSTVAPPPPLGQGNTLFSAGYWLIQCGGCMNSQAYMYSSS